MVFTLSRVLGGRVVGVETYDYEPITKDNYAERVREMESLAPEWKTLENAPVSVLHLFSPDLYLHQDDSSDILLEVLNYTRKQEIKAILSEEEQSFLNAEAIQAQPNESEAVAERMIREAWERDRLPLTCAGRALVKEVEKILGYKFMNEYLCVQAFTHHSFTRDCKDAWGCAAVYENNEALSFLGNAALNAAVSRIMQIQYCHHFYDDDCDYGSFLSCDDGKEQLTEIRSYLVSKENLCKRCLALGLETFIRRREGKAGEAEDTQILNNTLEALIGAVAVDCDWKIEVLEAVVGEVLDVFLPYLAKYKEEERYEEIYFWTKKRFGVEPQVKIRKTDRKYPAGFWIYESEVSIPNPGISKDDLEKTAVTFTQVGIYNVGSGMWPSDKEHTKITEQEVICEGEGRTRSDAREEAARRLLTLLRVMHV